MIDFRPFYQQIATTNLSAWLETLPLQLKEWEKQTHGDYAKWSKIVDFLPDLQADTIDLKNAVKSDRTSPLSEGEKQRIVHHLKQLMPWRKGPYHLFDIHVDCEWRSDFKWDRVLPHLMDESRAFPLHSNDIVQIRRSRYLTRLVHLSEKSFCEVFAQKMLPGGFQS